MRRSHGHSGGGAKATGRNGQSKFKGRFSSTASLQSALNLKRKEAFDNESHMLDETTTDDNITFETSTTDYLRRRDSKSRNFDASFDESDTSASRGKEPAAKHSKFASASPRERCRMQEREWESPRDRKRLQEREWERDRQRKATVASKAKGSRRKSYETTAFHKLGSPIEVDLTEEDDDDDSIIDHRQSLQPRSSRQLGSTPIVKNTMARDGYDSDSYSMKAGRQKAKVGRHPTTTKKTRQIVDVEESHTDTSLPIQSLLEDSTTNFDDSMAFAPSTVVDSKADSTSATDSFLAESAGKTKMTKMEKIKQLQSKNERYKEEYKKTYLEKKEFKKKYEDKKMEVNSLTSEIESYMKETALLKKQLHQLTSEMDGTENSARKDSAKVAELQKELQHAKGDLKQALSRLAERKIESSQLQEILKRKDEQIESLTLEVSQQIEEVQKLQAQLSIKDMDSCNSNSAKDTDARQKLEQLKEENKSMKAELSMTLNRAAEMVKNREGTIEILRKENTELKELMDIRNEDDDRTTTSEKIRRKEGIIEQLRTELAGLKEVLSNNTEDKEELKEIIKNREAELDSIKVDVEGLKKMVKRAEKEACKAKREVDEKDVSISTLKGEVRDLKNERKEAARVVEDMNQAIACRDMDIQQLQEKVKLLKENKDGSNEQLGKARTYLQEKEGELKALYRENEDLKADLLQQKETLDERRKTLALELENTKIREKKLQDQLEAASSKVKRREEAIEDLMKESETLKKYGEDKDCIHTDEMNKYEQNLAKVMQEAERLKIQLNEKEEQLENTREMVKEREVAIEDLLRDIDDLKRDGSDLEKRVTTRTDKLSNEIKTKNGEIEKLQMEVESLTGRLDEAQRGLEAKSRTLQDREEEIEELLQAVSELKQQNENALMSRVVDDKQADEEREALRHALDTSRGKIKEREEDLRRLVRENTDLRNELDALKAKKEGRFGYDQQDSDDDSEEEETRSYLVAQHEVLEEEIQQLNDQVNELQEELEQVHRQNSILNEEIEDWLQRGGNFELEIQRLRNEIEGWEDRAEQLRAAAEASGGDSLGSTSDIGDQQAMLLEKAMAERQRKAMGGQGKGVWGLFFNQSEEGEELTEDQKRIRELEAIKDAQAEELQKVKSDLVKLTTSSRNDSYVSKKKVADLEEENEGYKAKVELLLRRLAEVQGVPYGEDDDEKKTDDPASPDSGFM